MKIAYYPYSNKTNRYIEISQRILKQCGCEIVPFDGLYKKNRHTIKQFDAVFLNWYDSVYGDCSILKIVRQIAKRKIKLIILKACGLKIVFTFHNRLPHNTGGKKKTKIFKNYLKWICKQSDYIILLSRQSKEYLKDYLTQHEIEKKTRYIPHPNYIGVYSPEIEENWYPQGNTFRVLFVGQVSRYKNINLILEMAEKLQDKDIIFHIVGMCKEEAYKKEIVQRAEGLSNVELDLHFVKDEELEQLLRQYHILLLPYDTRSSMNSGTVMLAFSNGRTVVCPEICTIQDFDMNDIYCYQYETEDDHREKMLQCVEEAYTDWITKRPDFEAKGSRLLQAVKENNSPEKLAVYYRSLLEEISRE